MRNIHSMVRIDHPNIAEAIETEIRHGCYRQVNKRLALRLARALLHPCPDMGDLLLAKLLISRLSNRIDYVISKTRL